jgi:hypothetical protein
VGTIPGDEADSEARRSRWRDHGHAVRISVVSVWMAFSANDESKSIVLDADVTSRARLSEPGAVTGRSIFEFTRTSTTPQW